MTVEESPTETAPFDWLKSIPRALLQLDTTPLLGNPPTFPWKEFEEKMRETFEKSSLTLTQEPPQWREADKLKEGLGDDLFITHFSISSIEGTICWLMSKLDYARLFSLLIANEKTNLATLEEGYLYSFSRFLSLELISIVEDLSFDPNLSCQITSEQQLPKESSLCLDIALKVDSTSLQSRLLLTPQFQQGWKTHYSTPIDPLSRPELTHKLPLTVHIEAGQTTLSKKEWLELKTGDFLLLDHCSYNPEERKGRVLLTVQGAPLFRAKLKEGKIKILEFPLYREVDATMNAKIPEEEESLTEEEGTDLEEEFEEEESFTEEEFEEEETNLENALKEEELEEEEIESEEEEEIEDLLPPKEEKENEVPPLAKQEPRISPEEVPLSLIVEVGRLEMSMQKVCELQPGNLLDLNVQPENGVDLIISGKKVGKGELLKIGNTLGVRITEIG